MKKTFFYILIFSIILAACGGNKNTPTTLPSMTPVLNLTASSTPTKILPTQPTSNPTITPFPPYPLKKVIFDYYVGGNRADFDAFFDPNFGNIITRLVIYDDGQMLVAGVGQNYTQKVLSPDETKSFLSKLELLGFFTLESNQEHDPTDKLYNFGNNYQPSSDGLWDCILVNAEKSRELCVRDMEIKYLIPEMKKILQYLDEYKPTEMTPYDPDRILLTLQTAYTSGENLTETVTPWEDKFPSLETFPRLAFLDTPSPMIFIDGDLAKEINLFFEDTDGWKVISQNGKEYEVVIRVLLPHERVINPFQ